MLSLVSSTSLTGSTTTSSRAPVERWLMGSNERISSSTSPNKSRRNGSGVPGGKRSTRPPRTANSPGSITVSDRP
jgi:hypothetical protein